MQNKSKKGFTLVEIMIVVVIIGLLAAMAVPAFQKVRSTSQNKAVVNNLRQITSAADQYFLETGLLTAVVMTDLVGSDKYIKALPAVANETYAANIVQGTPYVISGLAAGVGGASADNHTPTAGSTTITADF
jgi:type IV pilus assembly protein PilA